MVQKQLSDAFVTIVIICIPLMLCVKPCVFCCSHKEEHHHEEEQEGHLDGTKADPEQQLLVEAK